MNILVISNSVIVKELIRLTTKECHYNIEYQNSAKDAQDLNYCLVFIDDSLQDFDSQLEFIKSKLAKSTVLLSNNKIEPNRYVDYTINKPFLPNDIKDILDKYEKSKKKEESNKKIETSILNPEEIAKIKTLMEMELNEDINEIEDDKSYILTLEEKESLKLKSKKAKKLLYELGSLGKKEFKKLLKGAKVSIKIEYKKSSNE